MSPRGRKGRIMEHWQVLRWSLFKCGHVEEIASYSVFSSGMSLPLPDTRSFESVSTWPPVGEFRASQAAFPPTLGSPCCPSGLPGAEPLSDAVTGLGTALTPPPWAVSEEQPQPVFALCPVLVTPCRLSVPAPLLFWHWFFLCSAFLCLFLLPSSFFYSLIFSFYSFFIFSIYILFFFFFFLRGRRFYRLYCLWPNQTPALSSLSHCLVTLCWWCLVTKSYPALLRP